MDEATQAAIRMFLARRALVDEWTQRVLADAKIPSAKGLEPFRLRDYVPRFIDVAGDVLRHGGDPREVRARGAEFGRIHAIDRLDAGFALDEVQHELSHLRDVLSAHLAHAVGPLAVINAALDAASDSAEHAYGASGIRLRAPSADVPAGLPAERPPLAATRPAPAAPPRRRSGGGSGGA